MHYTLPNYSNNHQNSLEDSTCSFQDKKSSFQRTPNVNLASNTVLDSHPQIGLNVHLDWIQGYLKTSSIDLFIGYLKSFFPTTEIIRSEKPKLDRHFKVVDSRLKDTSILLQHEFLKEGEGLTRQRKCLVIIPGKVISSLPLGVQCQLCCELYLQYDFICSRIDIAIDDYDRTIDRRKILKACRDKNLCAFKSYEEYGSAATGEEIKNKTLYLGSKNSDKYIRFYNAEPLHGIAADRWELQLRKKYANELFASFIEYKHRTSREIAKPLIVYFLNSLSFVNRINKNGKRERNVARCPMLPWWKKFTKKVESY